MRQYFVLNLDELDRFGSDRRACGGDSGDSVTFIERLLARHDIAGHVPHVDLGPYRAGIGKFLLREVVPGSDCVDPLQRLGFRCIDRLDPRMWVRAPQDLAAERTGQIVIVSELCRASYFRYAVRSHRPCSNQSVGLIQVVHFVPFQCERTKDTAGDRLPRRVDMQYLNVWP